MELFNNAKTIPTCQVIDTDRIMRDDCRRCYKLEVNIATMNTQTKDLLEWKHLRRKKRHYVTTEIGSQ